MLIACCFHHAAKADEQAEFVKPLCMSEDWTRHFSVHREVIQGMADSIYRQDKYPEVNKGRVNALARNYHLLFADKFSYSCSLTSTYPVFGNRPTSNPECDYGGQIVLSVKRDDHLILDQVPFSPWCVNRPSAYVADFNADDNEHDTTITISNGESQRELPLNHFSRPLTAVDVDCLVRKGYLDTQLPNRERALNTCLPTYVK